MKKETKSKIEFTFFMIFYKIFNLFPYKLNKAVVTGLFIFSGMIIGARKKVAERNLHMVFPEKSEREIKAIMREMYRQMGLTAAEIYFGDIRKLYKKFSVEGLEYLQEAHSLDKGVIVATGHFGNWELAGRYIARSYKLSVIYKKLRNQYFDDFNNKIRNDENCVLIEKKKALRPILKLLGEKYLVTIMIDQNAHKKGMVVDFLGHPASTFIGTAKIAIKTGTPIVIAITMRDENDNNILVFEPMIDVSGYDNSQQSIKELTQLISNRVGRYVLEYPGQWFWVHRRWRGYKKARIK